MDESDKKYKKTHKFRLNRKRYNERYYKRFGNSPNGGERYTSEEIDIIMEHMICDKKTAEKLGRSLRAVQIARCRMKKRQ